MDAWKGLLAGPRGDYPRGPSPSRALPQRPWIVLGLLVACLVPRLVVAWNWNILWGDSLRFRYASILLEQGDFEHGFAEFGLNVYPLLLIPLRHLGIDWQITGKYFGLLVATLTVLPLWGWLRRMFDDRLATIACLTYAFHGKLIAVSPLILRDSTFWFFMVLALYFTWRAVGDLRLHLFLAAGISLTLALHTRTEGWLLLVPLAGWAACRWPTARGNRLRLIGGVLLSIAVIPAAVAAVNLTWLRHHPRWEFFRTAHIGLAVDWWNQATGMRLAAPASDYAAIPTIIPQRAPPPDPAAPPQKLQSREFQAKNLPPLEPIDVPEAVPPVLKTSSRTLTVKMLERLAKAFGWVGSVLLVVGLICGWKVLLRPEHLTLLAFNALLLVITRIRYGISGLDQRYFLPIVIIGMPWMAWGLDTLVAAVRRLAARRQLSSGAPGMIVCGLIVILLALNFWEGPIAVPAYMHTHADLGRWIARHARPEPGIAGNIDEMALETFYAQGRVVSIFWPRDCLKVPVPASLARQDADVVVLWNDDHNIAREYLPIIEERITGRSGYRRVSNKELPLGEDELMVFVKR